MKCLWIETISNSTDEGTDQGAFLDKHRSLPCTVICTMFQYCFCMAIVLMVILVWGLVYCTFDGLGSGPSPGPSFH